MYIYIKTKTPNLFKYIYIKYYIYSIYIYISYINVRNISLYRDNIILKITISR